MRSSCPLKALERVFVAQATYGQLNYRYMRKTHFVWAVLAVVAIFLPWRAEAHQPRLVNQDKVQISNPTVSQAFYDELKGKPRDYYLKTDGPLDLTLQLLVPASVNPDKMYSAEVFKDDSQGSWLVQGELDGMAQSWTKFHEEFANDDYLQSQEYALSVPAGRYNIRVRGPVNELGIAESSYGKYVLVVGKEEAFPPAEIWNAWRVVPKLKTHFFDVSPLTLLGSQFGPYAFIALLLLNLLFWFAALKVVKSQSSGGFKPRLVRNLGWPDRIGRLILGAGLVVLAIHLWSLIIFMLGGFVLYEGLAGWCALYAALGKRTCPISR
jgi:hypothetical protein